MDSPTGNSINPIALALRRAKQTRTTSTTTSMTSLDKELDYYDQFWRSFEPNSDTFNEFAFWSEMRPGNEHNPSSFSVLASIAPDILAIPASTAPLERIFSQIGQVIGFNRNKISDSAMVKEVFIRCNKQYLHYSKNL
jgi:hypothetical protein